MPDAGTIAALLLHLLEKLFGNVFLLILRQQIELLYAGHRHNVRVAVYL